MLPSISATDIYSPRYIEGMSNQLIMAMVAIIAIVIATPTISAQGQFATQPGQTFTVADIEGGKTAYLSAKQEVAILSGSMLPNYQVGEYVTLDYTFPFENVTVGDVIAFRPDPEEVKTAKESGVIVADFSADYIMHRVVSVDSEDGLTTKGDNNDFSIDGLEEDITEDMYIGKVVEEVSHQ